MTLIYHNFCKEVIVSEKKNRCCLRVMPLLFVVPRLRELFALWHNFNSILKWTDVRLISKRLLRNSSLGVRKIFTVFSLKFCFNAGIFRNCVISKQKFYKRAVFHRFFGDFLQNLLSESAEKPCYYAPIIEILD